MNIKKGCLVPVAALLTAAVLSAGVAQAESPSIDMRQIRVSYGDLNLSHARGAERLYRRLQAAAAEVCRSPVGDPILARVRQKTCVNEATEAAVASVNEPELTKVHVAKTGKREGTQLAAK